VIHCPHAGRLREVVCWRRRGSPWSGQCLTAEGVLAAAERLLPSRGARWDSAVETTYCSSGMCRLCVTKGGGVIEGLSFRDGEQVDLPRLTEIESICFSPGDPDRKSASRGELADGLATRQILVAERVRGEETAVVAYVQYHAIGDGHEYYVEGVAVHPEVRGANLARDLLVELRQRLHHRCRANPVLAMTVSPRNVAMIRSALAAGFFGSDFVSDYFGPREDRIYFRSPLSPYAQLGESLFLPVDAYREVSIRMANGYVLATFEKLPQGASYCLRKRTHDDPAPLSANETAVSLTVAATLLAAFAFLFGISIASAIVPNDIRLFLGFGLLSSTFAVLIYGKSSGELSRIRRGVFNVQMQAGNLFSEFGGHYSLILLTPVVISRVTQSTSLSVILCICSVIGLAWYHNSGLALIDRYELPLGIGWIIKWTLTFSSTGALAELLANNSTTWWTVGNLLLLTVTMILAWVCGGEQTSPGGLRRLPRWRNRRAASR
jgi:ribosomal protein S18 acetylase RimI-like enzyme